IASTFVYTQCKLREESLFSFICHIEYFVFTQHRPCETSRFLVEFILSRVEALEMTNSVWDCFVAESTMSTLSTFAEPALREAKCSG
ncbi:MAG: hypothetical protein ACRENT_07540, partial [Thermodesulfobacteriota bacterium]